MYPRNAASPERIAVGAVVQISDGAVQSSGVDITVRGHGGAEGAGAGTTSYGASGIVYYTPTQGETDFTSFVVIASKAGCVPVAVTVVTSASATAGYAGTDQGKIANPTSTVNLSGTTVKTATDVEADTQDIQSRLPAALVGGRMDSNAGAISGDVGAADNAEAFFDGTGYAGTNNVIPTVTTLTGHTPQTGDVYALANGGSGFVAIKAQTAAIETDTQDLQARTPAALTAGGNMKADALAISGSTEAADRLERSTHAIVLGTCDAGGTTTTLVASSLSPASAVNDQFVGRIITFDKDTTTAALRGQATDITDYVHATLTFTFTALTTAAAAGDTFTIT